jgi:hypothetical protein
MDSDERTEAPNTEGGNAPETNAEIFAHPKSARGVAILFGMTVFFTALMIVLIVFDRSETRIFRIKFGILFWSCFASMTFWDYFLQASEWRIANGEIIAKSRLREKKLRLSKADRAAIFRNGGTLVLHGLDGNVTVYGLKSEQFREQARRFVQRLRVEGITPEEGAPYRIDPMSPLFDKLPFLHFAHVGLILVFLPTWRAIACFNSILAIGWLLGVLLYVCYVRAPSRVLAIVKKWREFVDRVPAKYALVLMALWCLSLYAESRDEFPVLSTVGATLLLVLSGTFLLALAIPALGWEAITFLFRRQMYNRWREAMAFDRTQDKQGEA